MEAEEPASELEGRAVVVPVGGLSRGSCNALVGCGK